jgi:LacI family transcriptional regulator
VSIKAKDIAKLLGVSASAVSLVLNNKPGVGDTKRREIIQKIREVGADHLLRSTLPAHDNIGFVVYRRKGNIIDEAPFFSYFLQSISEKLEKLQYNLTLLYMNGSMSAEEQHAVLDGSKCIGLIVFAVEMVYEDMQVFKESKLPFVMLDNSFLVNDVDTVAINNTYGIHRAVTYLHQRGHRHIGYIASKVVINSFSDRLTAYKNAMRSLDLSYSDADIVQVGYSVAEAHADMYAYVRRRQTLPTAFAADNDLLACGALKGIQEAGLRVPEDISLIGFDDRPICTSVTPTLTTMMVPKAAFGGSCVDLLIGKIEQNRSYALKVEIGTPLIERESVCTLLEK